MVTIIDGMQTFRSVCLYSSGISYATVKSRFPPEFMRRASLAGIVQSFLALPESGSSLLLLLCFRGSFARLISVSPVRPATQSHWNTDASLYTRMVYIQAGASLRPRCFPVLAKAFASLVFPGFGCPELLR